MNSPIYLDYASTTPTDPRVLDAMVQFMGPNGTFGNPSSRWHCFGQEAEAAIEQSRAYVAELVKAAPNEIVWTSGATESDNLALKGVALAAVGRGRHIITSEIEHKAVLDTCAYLEGQGFDVTYLEPNRKGMILPRQVESALRPDTILVSLMHVNNEIGTITDIASIGEITSKRDVLFHTDAAQSAARLSLDTRKVKVDLMSLSGHKLYGPKGIGALYVRRSSHVPLEPQMHGGGHEAGLRSGTLATHQIVGMGEAARILKEQMSADKRKCKELAKKMLIALRRVGGVSINGDRKHCVPDIINLTFASVESESLMMMLRGVAVSKGSACTSARVEPSHVLMAMGLDEDTAHSSIRISLGRFTKPTEIDRACRDIIRAVRELREVSFVSSANFQGE